MIDGKAKLVSDIYCDGLGDCLAPCPTGAISIVTRKADAFDPEAVKARMESLDKEKSADPLPCGCPGTMAKSLKPAVTVTPKEETLACGCPGTMSRSLKDEAECSCGCGCDCEDEAAPPTASELMNWPVQLKLIPPGAPYLKGADLLLAADCTAVAVSDFHARFLKNRPVAIVCPKLEDNEPQIAKLAEIIRAARPASVTVLRMEVPCCGGLVRVAEEAIRSSGIEVPLKKVVIGVDGLTA
jgi:hypothetical protein